MVLSAEPVTMIPVSGKTIPAQTPRLWPESCITSRSFNQTLKKHINLIFEPVPFAELSRGQCYKTLIVRKLRIFVQRSVYWQEKLPGKRLVYFENTQITGKVL